MRKAMTWVTTVSLLGAWTGVAGAHGLWTTELVTWIVRWYVMQAGGQWR